MLFFWRFLSCKRRLYLQLANVFECPTLEGSVSQKQITFFVYFLPRGPPIFFVRGVQSTSWNRYSFFILHRILDLVPIAWKWISFNQGLLLYPRLGLLGVFLDKGISVERFARPWALGLDLKPVLTPAVCISDAMKHIPIVLFKNNI